MTNEPEFHSPDDERFEQTLRLLELAKDGDRQALNDLLHRYASRVLELVRVRLGNRLRTSVESADLLQEAMLVASRKIGSFEPREEARFVNWLARIVEHQILDEATRQGALKRSMLRDIPIDREQDADGEGPGPIELPSILPTPSENAAGVEHRELVNTCLSDLPERYREVILLRDYAGASWAEIVEELHLKSPGAGQMLYHRGTQVLGELLRKRGLG